ncbi:MAG: hypothetical protein SFX73_09300 [Kofleriaceae bacterium]|nr:hypothetical protein [Kofleriaceae bacterium]
MAPSTDQIEPQTEKNGVITSLASKDEHALTHSVESVRPEQQLLKPLMKGKEPPIPGPQLLADAALARHWSTARFAAEAAAPARSA